MSFDFIEWYNNQYPEECFENPTDRLDHQRISYSGWVAALKYSRSNTNVTDLSPVLTLDTKKRE
jgi:hypothetical protein